MPRKLSMDRGEEEEEETTEWQEAGGGKGRMSPERDGGEMRKMGESEIGGDGMKGQEIHHPQTERDTVLEEMRRGEGIETGRKREVETETGLERKIEIVTMIEREIEIEEETGRGTEIEMVKEIEKERDPVFLHHHREIIGATVLPLLGH